MSKETKRASEKIQSGAWKFMHTTIVDSSHVYAVQQYRDEKGLVQTVGLTREGNVVTVAQ